MEDLSRISLLGVRGSVPASDAARYGKYGVATMCVSVQMAGETILLDGGSGLLNAGPSEACTLLLSHPHADHLLGLPVWPPLFRAGFHVDIWARTRGGLGPMEQAAALMSPPLWPVGPKDLPAEPAWRSLPEGSVSVGRVLIDHAEGRHPGGVTVFRLSAGGRSVVYATDCELDGPTRERLIPLAADCDLLLCDAQYTDEEYPQRLGWGHSSLSMALAFSAQCRARRTVLIHHAPFRTDAELDALENEIRRARPDCGFGKQSESFLL